MNESEVSDWRRLHSSLHSDFAGWLRSLTDTEYQNFVSATEVCLRDCAFDAACKASQEMFAGRIPKPFAFSAHPAAIRERTEPAYSRTEETKKTIGEIEESRRAASGDPIGPISPLLREMLTTIGCDLAKAMRPEKAGPQSGACSRIMACPYCAGKAVVIDGIGHCPDCCCRFDPERGQAMTYEESQLAKAFGENRREKTKQLGKR